MNEGSRKLKKIAEYSGHFEVEGRHYSSMRKVYMICVSKGYIGGLTTIATRLKKGYNRWSQLTALPCKTTNQAKRAQTLANRKQEMQNILDEIDKRKKELADN